VSTDKTAPQASSEEASSTSAGPAKLIPELSVVMPAYNEEAILPMALAEAEAAVERLCEQWEILIVDDGSTDSTPEILADWHRREPRVKVLTQTPNQGYSKALIRGFGAAGYAAVFYTDADAQFDLAEIDRLYPHLAEVDMVAGYRIGRQDPWIRLLTSASYNMLQSLVLGLNVRDVNCAFKLFRRSFFERIRLASDGFLIDAELYARAKRAGLRWAQVGVTHRPREKGSSTVRVATVTETLRELMALRRALRS
jgi:glycosyltransferase involved in cell wall biosynthesis